MDASQSCEISQFNAGLFRALPRMSAFSVPLIEELCVLEELAHVNLPPDCQNWLCHGAGTEISPSAQAMKWFRLRLAYHVQHEPDQPRQAFFGDWSCVSQRAFPSQF